MGIVDPPPHTQQGPLSASALIHNKRAWNQTQGSAAPKPVHFISAHSLPSHANHNHRLWGASPGSIEKSPSHASTVHHAPVLQTHWLRTIHNWLLGQSASKRLHSCPYPTWRPPPRAEPTLVPIPVSNKRIGEIDFFYQSLQDTKPDRVTY